MKTLIDRAALIQKDLKEYLIAHLDDLAFDCVDTHYVTYQLLVDGESYAINIWTANTKESTSFYNHFSGVDLNDMDYTDEEREKLWQKAQSDKGCSGEKRSIAKTQLSNDLFFSFDGVHGKVKFTGYNDNDWWTKYAPKIMKEDGEIIWDIDLEKMVATYKPLKP